MSTHLYDERTAAQGTPPRTTTSEHPRPSHRPGSGTPRSLSPGTPRLRGDHITEIKLTAGTIDYRDTGGDGHAIVPLHGLLMYADLLPHGRVVEIDDSYTLIPRDQPKVLARLIASAVSAAQLEKDHA